MFPDFCYEPTTVCRPWVLYYVIRVPYTFRGMETAPTRWTVRHTAQYVYEPHRGAVKGANRIFQIGGTKLQIGSLLRNEVRCVITTSRPTAGAHTRGHGTRGRARASLRVSHSSASRPAQPRFLAM